MSGPDPAGLSDPKPTPVQYLWMFIVGLIVGIIARLTSPRRFIMSLIGALIVLFIYDKIVA